MLPTQINFFKFLCHVKITLLMIFSVCSTKGSLNESEVIIIFFSIFWLFEVYANNSEGLNFNYPC